MIDTEGRAMVRPTPTHADLERAIVSVPGVAEAHVTRVEETGKSRLRIRLTNDDDAESVSWAIAATLRERFGISLDPDQIRPRTMAAPVVADVVNDPHHAEVAEESDEDPGAEDSDGAVFDPADPAAAADVRIDDVEGRDVTAAAVVAERDVTAAAMVDDPEEGEVLVSGDRVLLSEAARALLEEAVAEARERQEQYPDDDPRVDDDLGLDDDADGFTGAATAEPDAVDASDDADLEVAEPAPAEPAPAEPAPAGNVTSLATAARSRDDGTRARIHHLDTRVDVSDVEVTATLGFGDRRVTGSARSVATEHGILRAVAEATLQALAELTGERLVGGVDSVVASVSGDPSIATVIVSLVTDRGDEALLGSSLVRKDPQRAVMRATLDALNRRVEPWLEVDIA